MLHYILLLKNQQQMWHHLNQFYSNHETGSSHARSKYCSLFKEIPGLLLASTWHIIIFRLLRKAKCAFHVHEHEIINPIVKLQDRSRCIDLTPGLLPATLTSSYDMLNFGWLQTYSTAANRPEFTPIHMQLIFSCCTIQRVVVLIKLTNDG